MDKTRMGEIALLYIKFQLKEKGVRLNPNFKREVGKLAKDIGITLEEALEFHEKIVRGIVEEVFAKQEAPIQQETEL